MDKYGVLSFNLNENTSPQMKIQFLILVILFSFQVTVGLSLPFLFYHPQSLECNINDTWTLCTEQEMCKNQYPYRFLTSEKFYSIPMEFGLFCGADKLQESFILSLTLIGQAAGFLMSMLFDIPKPHKAKMMLFTIIVEFMILGSIKMLILNSLFLTLILFGWNFIFAFYFGQQYAYICDVYSATINNCAPVILGFFQPFLGLFYLIYANANGNWKDHLVNFTAFPLLIVGFVWFFSYDYRQDELEANKEEKSKIAKIDTNNFIQDLLYKYNELITQPKLCVNFIMYILCWFNSNMAYTSSFLVFNDIKSGSFMKNLVVSQFTDVIGALFAWVLFKTYPSRNVMFGSSLIAGIIQVGTQAMGPNPGYWIEMGPILVAKAYKSLMVGGLLIVTPQLVPFRYLLLLFTFSNIITLGLTSLMPFYKMFMDQIKINCFVGFGVISFISCYYIRKWTYKEDIGIIETYDPNSKKDKAAQMLQGGMQPIRGQKNENHGHEESLLK